ncbi:hypothetical protein CF319_g7810 [Tilletia indica]|nr:hypothetical protein CF319_g7810 [Tilletia indica]
MEPPPPFDPNQPNGQSPGRVSAPGLPPAFDSAIDPSESANSAAPNPATSTSSAAPAAPQPSLPSNGASHWHFRFRQDIRTLQMQHARNIKSLSDKANVEVTTVRRYVDRTFKSYKKQNTWNSFRRWAKRNPSAPGAPTSGQSHLAAYRALTSANRAAIKTWNIDRLEDAPKWELQKEFNAACRDLTDRLRHLQLRYGITAAVVLAHPRDGIRPLLALSTQSASALGAAVNRIKAGKTADDLASMFDKAVKIKVWERTNAEEAMANVVLKAALPPAQQLAKDLIDYIHAVIGPAVAALQDTTMRDKWIKATGDGKRLRYKGFFSLLAELGFFVEGWPIEAFRLIGSDAVTNVPESPPLPTSVTIWSGSIHNTSAWTEGPVLSLKEAIRDGTLRVVGASEAAAAAV